VKIGLLSFVLAWRFLENFSLPELVTCHFPSLVKAYWSGWTFWKGILPQVH
jgi:hypothetical protein